MYKTEYEIMHQHEALLKTFGYMQEKKDSLIKFFKDSNLNKIMLIGSGSSYMLSKAGAEIFRKNDGISTLAVSAGDYVLDPEGYKNDIKGALVIAPSRSGLTTEMLDALRHIKKNYDNPVLAITMKEGSTVTEIADYSLVMPWSYDESVCQTRTVTTIYTTILLLNAFFFDNTCMQDEICKAIQANEAFKKQHIQSIEKVVEKDWEKVVVLADNVLSYLAEEGALAFGEISQIPFCQYNLLDYRHGPMVLCDNKTLVIAVIRNVSSEAHAHQQKMPSDLKAKGSTIVAVTGNDNAMDNADLSVCVGDYKNLAVWGIPFIYIPQMLSFKKALKRGVNPDLPTGLNSFITL